MVDYNIQDHYFKEKLCFGVVMDHRVVEIKVHGTRRKVLLRNDMPTFYPNLYITSECSARALSTQDKILRHIAVLEDFLIHEKIDLESRLIDRPSKGLTDAEVSRLVADAALTRDTLDTKYSGIRLLDSAYEFVEAAYVNARLEHIRDYLEYLYIKLADEASRDDLSSKIKNSINLKIQAARPAWKRRKIDQIKGLDNDQRERLLSIAHYESEENPFDTDANRLRNYIIVLLGVECGLRRAEMLLLKTSDIDFSRREIAVRALTSSISDLRIKAPGFKTHERKLQISDELVFAIKDYTERYRSNIASARKHPFLLVSHRRNEGQAITLNGVDNVLPRIVSVAPQLEGVTLHTLRHDCVYTLLDSMREELETLTPEDRTTKVQKVLTWAFGWSPESEMPALYGAKFWHEEANRAMKKRVERFSSLVQEDIS